MSKLVLYSREVSPPCRAVLLAAEAIGVTLEIRDIDLLARENLSEEFVKMNPQHTVPTLDDNGFILWDSHAIICYLVNKYAKDDSLYPKDPQKRAVVDQRLHFDNGVLFSTMRGAFYPVIMQGETSIPNYKIEQVEKAFGFLEKFLEGKKWLAGDSYTLADISTVASVTGLSVLKPLDSYPNLKAWLARCEQELPGYQKLNVPGDKELHELINSKLAGN